jgi:hypothetical protein
MEDMYLELEFFGQIETTEAFKALVGALAKLDTYEDDANAARQALIEANIEGEGFKINEDMYNIREDAVKGVIEVAKKYKIDLVSTVTAGGMDDQGTIQFVRGGFASFELPIMNNEVMVSSEVIAKLKKRGLTTLDQLDQFLGHFKVTDLPKFTVADEVIIDISLPKRRT